MIDSELGEGQNKVFAALDIPRHADKTSAVWRAMIATLRGWSFILVLRKTLSTLTFVALRSSYLVLVGRLIRWQLMLVHRWLGWPLLRRR